MYRQAVRTVNGRKLVKARVVTFSNIFSSFAIKEVAIFLSDFTKVAMCRQISLRFLNMKLDSLCYFLTNTDRRGKVNMQFSQLFCASAYKFVWIHLAMNLTLGLYTRGC